MKARKTLVLILCLVPLVYTGQYAALRLSRYFVRQEFLCFSCGESLTRTIEERYPSDEGPLLPGRKAPRLKEGAVGGETGAVWVLL